MKVVLFDLGRTLENQDVLLPGAVEMLTAVCQLQNADGQPPVLGLVSDFDMPDTPADVPAIRQEYYSIITALGIRQFFEPVDSRVTLSTDVGVFKPDERVFRAALDKIGAEAQLAAEISFAAAMFVTEHPVHVAAARALGMRAVHFQGPGQTTGDISNLLDLVPLVQSFVAPTPVRAAIGAWQSVSAAIPLPGTSWTRFGDDILLFGGGGGWSTASARIARSASPRRQDEVPRDHLHLVIQKGRLFQRGHSDVPVLLDRGRYLVVALDPARAARIGRHTQPCYTVRPLDDRYVAFETRSRSADRAAEVPWVRALVNSVAQPDYQADLEHLVSFTTRHSTSPGYTAAAEWAAGRLETMGYQTDVRTISVNAATSANVVADRLGSGPMPHKVVIATAHLDSINHEGGASAPAPGADDNASGSAGVLQIARSLQNHTSTDDLRLILFGGEEQGLFGSRQYVDGLSTAERGRIRAVVNMDMIGCLNQSPPSVLIEGAAVSQNVIDGLAAAAATYTGLTVEISLNPFASDHKPFIDNGLPAVLTIEGADQTNPHDHTGDDVIGNISYEIALEILRMNVAFVALAIGQAEDGPA